MGTAVRLLRLVLLGDLGLSHIRDISFHVRGFPVSGRPACCSVQAFDALCAICALRALRGCSIVPTARRFGGRWNRAEGLLPRGVGGPSPSHVFIVGAFIVGAVSRHPVTARRTGRNPLPLCWSRLPINRPGRGRF